ncbi:MAG: NS1 [SAfia-838D_Ambidensovirus]|uniref:NS1 n=1 Tax=SAfia-838D_Ambidensovirus TaxID=3070158 RepID=A0A8K1XS05_9VIRU|nr:MAG: NS1 [Ambidensovirus sp.]UGV24204.1 MAG: NS1 [SAfia-838D_Ambidensovirus]
MSVIPVEQVLEEIWDQLPDQVASHPGTWWKIYQLAPLEPLLKEKFKGLLIRWSKMFKEWSIGSLQALKKKIGKTQDTIFLMYMPVTQKNELMLWLEDSKSELELSEEALSELLSTMITSTQSTHARMPTSRAGVSSRTSQKRKKTLDDIFESLAPSKRSKDEIGKISSNIFLRKGEEQRSLKCTVPIKEYLLKFQLYPTLAYQAKMAEDHTQAWRTAMIRCNLTLNQEDPIYQKVQQVVENAIEEISFNQEDQEEFLE